MTEVTSRKRDYDIKLPATRSPEQYRHDLWPADDPHWPDLQTALLESELVVADEQGQLHWHPRLDRALTRVARNCRSYEICAHSADHLMHVLHNVSTLLGLLPEEQIQAIDPKTLVEATLLHDIGYAMDSSRFTLHHAPDHVSEATSDQMARVRGRRREDKDPPRTRRNKLFPKDEYPALHRLLSEEPNGTPLNLSDRASEESPEEYETRLIWSLVLLADKLDYFRAERVAGLNHEQYIEDYHNPETKTNWYYWLAYAVEDYALEPDPLTRTLTIRFRFKPEGELPVQRQDVEGNVRELTHLEHWWEGCRDEENGYYAQRVFGIALQAVESIGWKLALAESPANHVQTQTAGLSFLVNRDTIAAGPNKPNSAEATA